MGEKEEFCKKIKKFLHERNMMNDQLMQVAEAIVICFKISDMKTFNDTLTAMLSKTKTKERELCKNYVKRVYPNYYNDYFTEMSLRWVITYIIRETWDKNDKNI